MTSSEDTSGDLPSSVDASHTILGLEARYWQGNAFFGAHFGRYGEALDVPELGDINGHSTGLGISAGWEGKDGLYVMGQYDRADGLDVWTDTDVDLTGFRMSVGYRWK